VQAGDILAVDLTGTRTAGLLGGQKVVVVASSNKIVRRPLLQPHLPLIA
jgi:hypothetical protein